MLDGEPVAFDAIEFDPLVASGDVLYDLAFLLMDLVERGLPEAANGVLNGYFAAARRDEDCEGLAALPLFMSLRAAIRAKVTAARLSQSADDSRTPIARAARRYFDLALAMLASETPLVVCTGGLSGTGKSVLARGLAPVLGRPPGALVLRSDAERKAMFGLGETERLPAEAYRPEVSAKLYAALNDKAGRIARAGYSVIVDAVFAKSSERAAIEATAQEAGAKFLRLFSHRRSRDASQAHWRAWTGRIGRRRGRGAHAGRFCDRHLNWTSVDASGTPDATLARARALLPDNSPDEGRGG